MKMESNAFATDALHITHDVGDRVVDAFVAQMAGVTPFHRTAWGRAIEAASGHKLHLLAVVDGAGALHGILPLHHVRSRLFGNALVSAGFAVDGGILATGDGAAAMLGQAAVDLATRLGVPAVELRGGPTPDGWQSVSDAHVGFVGSILADDDAQLAAIPRKHRAEVRKALANDLTVSIGRDAAARADHYRIYATSVRNLGTPVFPRALFNRVLDNFGEDADILTIHHQGAAVASVLSLYDQDSVYPFWGGGTQAARGLRANEMLYFALMRHARTRGCTQFDFGRSKVGSGPAAYKKNWGFDAMPLSYSHWSKDGWSRDINPNSAKYRAMVTMWQRLPLPLANFLGPLIARQLG